MIDYNDVMCAQVPEDALWLASERQCQTVLNAQTQAAAKSENTLVDLEQQMRDLKEQVRTERAKCQRMEGLLAQCTADQSQFNHSSAQMATQSMWYVYRPGLI